MSDHALDEHDSVVVDTGVGRGNSSCPCVEHVYPATAVPARSPAGVVPAERASRWGLYESPSRLTERLITGGVLPADARRALD